MHTLHQISGASLKALHLTCVHLFPCVGSGRILSRSGTEYPLRSLFLEAESATVLPVVTPPFGSLLMYGRRLTTCFRPRGSSCWLQVFHVLLYQSCHGTRSRSLSVGHSGLEYGGYYRCVSNDWQWPYGITYFMPVFWCGLAIGRRGSDDNAMKLYYRVKERGKTR